MLHFLRRQWLHPRSFYASRSIVTAAASPATTPRPPNLVITPGSTHHNNLTTFLDYAQRVNLSPKTTVYVGTHYEYTVATSLLRLGFSLIRTGRRADNGIDLLGYWAVPTLPEPLSVLIQCKAQKSVGPNYVRELEGSFANVPADWRRRNVLGLLVTTQKATRSVLETMGMNRWPMGFLKITKRGVVEQFVWNRSAVERGLEGVGVTVRYASQGVIDEEVEGAVKEDEEALRIGRGEEKDIAKMKRRKARNEKIAISRDIQLTWMGRPIFADRESLDEKTVKLGEAISSVDAEPDAEDRLVKGAATGEKKRVKPEPTKKSSKAKSTASKPSLSTKKASVKAPNTNAPVRKVGRPRKTAAEASPVKSKVKKSITSGKSAATKALDKTRAKKSTVSKVRPTGANKGVASA